ncbi:MAG: ribonuclease III [Thermoanaerobaculum sp.]|nr:ribonuclease III [Thermoanaerobaculum sp.]
MSTQVKQESQTVEVEDRLRQVEARLGYRFRRPELLEEALRHRSAAAARGLPSNERLEFLGDAALSHAVAELLFARWPQAREGELTRARAALVRRETLAGLALSLGLGEALERAEGVEPGEALLADALEAVLGAMSLELGFRRFARFVQKLLAPAVLQLTRKELLDLEPKSALQELSQKRGWELPVYRQVEVRGPEHQRIYVFEVEVGGRVYGRGEGSSKKLAQRAAAREALLCLQQGSEP